jgi:predicted TIM-barrel fold metal-dependent hydrolase
MGFFPYRNNDPSQKVNTVQRRPNLQALDARLLEMFQWCAENGVPVMAHADESMGTDAVADDFGGPEGWQALLHKMRDGPLPIVNIAHFGGDVPPPDHPENQWPTQFAELFDLPEGKHLYADLGFWTALCTCDTWTTEGKAAISRLEAVLRKHLTAARRLMYGTDWFMISTKPMWATYFNDLIDNLQSVKSVLPMERLFYGNAVECFGLGNGGAQRDRVLSFYSGVSGGAPSWLIDSYIS